MYMYINANISNVTDVVLVEQECPPFRTTRAHPGFLVGFVFLVNV